MGQALKIGQERVPFRAEALAPGRLEGATFSRLGPTTYAALYRDRRGLMVAARDARGEVIVCETRELAQSVAEYRLQRLKPFEEQHAN